MSLLVERLARLIALAAATLAASVALAEACQCGNGQAICEQYKTVDIAFVGRVTVAPSGRADGHVLFRVTQALKGVSGPEVTVPTPASYMGGVECFRQFDVGGEYLVFAHRSEDGEIDLSPCRSTVWRLDAPASASLDEAWAEGNIWAYINLQGASYRRAVHAAAFAESLRQPATGGRVFGEVTVRVPFSAPDDEDGIRRVDGATVLLRSPDEERRTTTKNGQYEFAGLPPGAYSLSVAMPHDLPEARSARRPDDPSAQHRFDFRREREHTERLAIADARDCRYVPFEAQFDGEVSGTIVSHDGTPPGQQTVELYPTTVDPRQRDGEPARVYTDARGTFRISHLPPGRYSVGINLRHGPSDQAPFTATFYRKPGTDEPLLTELGNGTRVDLGVLRLPPPLPKRRIAGTVRWSDGRPLRDVEVSVCESGSKPLRVYCDAQRLSADGRFSLDLFAGTTYRVVAQAADPRMGDIATGKRLPPIGTAAATVSLERDVEGLRLVLVPRRDRDKRRLP